MKRSQQTRLWLYCSEAGAVWPREDGLEDYLQNVVGSPWTCRPKTLIIYTGFELEDTTR